jgi:hypothetical protein
MIVYRGREKTDLLRVNGICIQTSFFRTPFDLYYQARHDRFLQHSKEHEKHRNQKVNAFLRRPSYERHAPDECRKHSVGSGSSVVCHLPEVRETNDGVFERFGK